MPSMFQQRASSINFSSSSSPAATVVAYALGRDCVRMKSKRNNDSMKKSESERSLLSDAGLMKREKEEGSENHVQDRNSLEKLQLLQNLGVGEVVDQQPQVFFQGIEDLIQSGKNTERRSAMKKQQSKSERALRVGFKEDENVRNGREGFLRRNHSDRQIRSNQMILQEEEDPRLNLGSSTPRRLTQSVSSFILKMEEDGRRLQEKLDKQRVREKKKSPIIEGMELQCHESSSASISSHQVEEVFVVANDSKSNNNGDDNMGIVNSTTDTATAATIATATTNASPPPQAPIRDSSMRAAFARGRSLRDCLARGNSLGKILSGLEEEGRVFAERSKSERQLVVSMFENDVSNENSIHINKKKQQQNQKKDKKNANGNISSRRKIGNWLEKIEKAGRKGAIKR